MVGKVQSVRSLEENAELIFVQLFVWNFAAEQESYARGEKNRRSGGSIGGW